jgi:hypothetical protein
MVFGIYESATAQVLNSQRLECHVSLETRPRIALPKNRTADLISEIGG